MARVMHVIPDTDMRGRQPSLIKQAKTKGLKWDEAKPGDVVVFINAKMDKIVLMTPLPEEDTFGLMGYYRSPHGRIDPRIIQYLSFNKGRFDVDRATKSMLDDLLPKRRIGLARTKDQHESAART